MQGFYVPYYPYTIPSKVILIPYGLGFYRFVRCGRGASFTTAFKLFSDYSRGFGGFGLVCPIQVALIKSHILRNSVQVKTNIR